LSPVGIASGGRAEDGCEQGDTTVRWLEDVVEEYCYDDIGNRRSEIRRIRVECELAANED
jgi:hypothetical protein